MPERRVAGHGSVLQKLFALVLENRVEDFPKGLDGEKFLVGNQRGEVDGIGVLGSGRDALLLAAHGFDRSGEGPLHRGDRLIRGRTYGERALPDM